MRMDIRKFLMKLRTGKLDKNKMDYIQKYYFKCNDGSLRDLYEQYSDFI